LIKLDSDREFEAPYGHFMPAIYAQKATRYLHEFDATKEDMAKVAVEARKWGKRHPEAEMYGEDELTIEDVLSSRPIASPLNLFDCAPYRTAGTGAAFIITEAERAEELQDKPVYITGSGEFNTHEYLSGLLEYRRDDGKDISFTRHGTSEAARQAYEMGGLTPDDIDVFELHTNFTHIGLIELEDVGLCDRGEAGTFVRNGGIDFNGGVPVNTNGGYLSFGQPGISMNPLVEAVRQIRNEALGVQVPNVTHALAHKAGGASACHSVNILSGGDAR
jgi:acetyl-CoA acetyltransferase